MGILFSRKTEPITADSLQNELSALNEEIDRLEQKLQDLDASQRSVSRKIIIFSLLSEIIWALLYFYVLNLNEGIRWFYRSRSAKTFKKLESAREQGEKKINEHLNAVSFQKTQNVLDRFGKRFIGHTPSPVNVREAPTNSGTASSAAAQATPGASASSSRNLAAATPVTPQAVSSTDSTPYATPAVTVGLRRRHVAASDAAPRTPLARNSAIAARTPTPSAMTPKQVVSPPGIFDRILDWAIGDGPQYGVALVCKRCSSHNGLVPRDEERTSFRCRTCGLLNERHESETPQQSTVESKENVKETTLENKDAE